MGLKMFTSLKLRCWRIRQWHACRFPPYFEYVGESFLSVIECIHTADTQFLSLMSLKSWWLLKTSKEPHARLPWHLALYINICSSHMKNPVQQAFHSVIALLGSGISRKKYSWLCLLWGVPNRTQSWDWMAAWTDGDVIITPGSQSHEALPR